MLWSRFEWDDWTVGISFGHIFTLHFGPIKASWVPKGTQFYNDLKRIGGPRQ